MSARVGIAGCCGRMGQAIGRLASQESDLSVSAAVEAHGHADVGRDYGDVLGIGRLLGVTVTEDAAGALRGCDVLIEFTNPLTTLEHAALAARAGVPLVIGTTGLAQPQVEALRAAAKTVPIVCSPNMSPGVNLLFELAKTAAARLGAGFDVEIVEAHHRHKQDAPSGTAKRLAEVVAAARGVRPDAVPVHALRAGAIVGDHTVVLAGPFERVELTHRAQGREVFARGALLAARFVLGRAPRMYDMADVLMGEGPPA
ncbi:MAG TPA: 4-hydroxy-tetrahydrodipicolinate reductase [bacterium]